MKFPQRDEHSIAAERTGSEIRVGVSGRENITWKGNVCVNRRDFSYYYPRESIGNVVEFHINLVFSQHFPTAWVEGNDDEADTVDDDEGNVEFIWN